ncbi:MAG: tetratricopeptide repeat protein [Bdellovibrionia bacterium]
MTGSRQTRLSSQVFIIISLMIFNLSQAFGKDVDPYQDAIKNGYLLVQLGNYAQAIIEFDKIYWNSKEHYNEALFYILYSQFQLGELDRVRANLAYLNSNGLNAEQKKILDQIKRKLPPLPTPEEASRTPLNTSSLAPAKTNSIYLSANGALITYSPQSLNKGGTFYEVLGNWSSARQSLTVIYSKTDLIQNANEVLNQLKTYQHQGFIAYSRNFWNHLSVGVSAAGLLNNDPDTNRGFLVGGSTTYYHQDRFYFGPEFYVSNYPGYNLNSTPLANPLRVYQGNLNLGFRLLSKPSFSLYTDYKGTWIRPMNPDDSASLLMNQNYWSSHLNLRLYSGVHLLTLGGWMGKQIFALQSDGHSLNNIKNPRTWNLTTSYSYTHGTNLRISLFLAIESLLEVTGSVSRPLASVSDPTQTYRYLLGGAVHTSF